MTSCVTGVMLSRAYGPALRKTEHVPSGMTSCGIRRGVYWTVRNDPYWHPAGEIRPFEKRRKLMYDIPCRIPWHILVGASHPRRSFIAVSGPVKRFRGKGSGMTDRVIDRGIH